MAAGGTLFGTDGIRGEVNRWPVSVDVLMRLGKVLGSRFRSLIVGKDNRSSSDMLEGALISGALCVGAEVKCVGCVTTPVISHLAKRMNRVGVMISASHNPFTDNGVKFFSPEGLKFTCELEDQIQRALDFNDIALSPPEEIKRINFRRDYLYSYVNHVVSLFGEDYICGEGFKVIFDCANGAITELVDLVGGKLIRNFTIISGNDDGSSINKDCGVMSPQNISEAVLSHKASLGVAFDGDGDRVVLSDENGIMIDGDQVLALLAKFMSNHGLLRSDSVVATVMSNYGLSRFLGSMGLELHRTDVGDRFVSRKMVELGSNLGGEKSGHLVLSDFGSSSDGLVAALQLTAICNQAGSPPSELFEVFEPMPQLVSNVRSGDDNALARNAVRSIIDDVQDRLGPGGRLVVRQSGTEKGLVRIMVESERLSCLSGLLEDLEKELSRV